MAKAPELTFEQQLKTLSAKIADLGVQVTHMQRMGGFTDAKTLSMRSTRLEERVEKTEAAVELLKDVSAHLTTLVADHLKTRHSVNLVEDNSTDTISFRRILRRMREFAEKTGLAKKRADLRETRQGENRLRPAIAEAAPVA